MQVTIQEGHNVAWATMGNKGFRAAPENVRPLSAVEEANRSDLGSHPREDMSIRPTHGGAQLLDLMQLGNPNANTPNPGLANLDTELNMDR